MSDKRRLSDRQATDSGQTSVILGVAEMQRVTIRIPDQQIKMLDMMVGQGEYPSTSEAVRAAVRDLIERKSDSIFNRVERLSVFA